MKRRPLVIVAVAAWAVSWAFGIGLLYLHFTAGDETRTLAFGFRSAGDTLAFDESDDEGVSICDHLPLALFFLVLPVAGFGVARAVRIVRSRRQRRPGLCTCGYDLRASEHRCPECGRPIYRGA